MERSLSKLVSVAFATVLLLSGCSETATMPSSAMVPTIAPGETLDVDTSSFILKEPSRWDIVVYEVSDKTNILAVGRVVALPRETIELSQNAIAIEGKAISQIPGSPRITYYPTNAVPSGVSTGIF